jgi:hypothetical protein
MQKDHQHIRFWHCKVKRLRKYLNSFVKRLSMRKVLYVSLFNESNSLKNAHADDYDQQYTLSKLTHVWFDDAHWALIS